MNTCGMRFESVPEELVTHGQLKLGWLCAVMVQKRYGGSAGGYVLFRSYL